MAIVTEPKTNNQFTEEEKNILENVISSTIEQPLTNNIINDIDDDSLKDIAKNIVESNLGKVEKRTKNLNIIEVSLPSQGKFYPINSSCYGVEKVRVRELIASDENILLSRKLVQTGKVFDVLIKSVLIDKNIKPEELLYSDKFAILLALRINDYGSDYDAKEKIECPYCENKFSPIYSLDKLQPKKLDNTNNVPVNSDGNISFTIPSGNTVEIKFLNNKEEDAIQEEIIASRRMTKNDGIDKTFTIRLKHHIVSIDGNKDKVYIKDFIENGSLKLKDSRAIMEFLNKNMPEISLEQMVSCPECYEEFEQIIPMSKEFWYPSA